MEEKKRACCERKEEETSLESKERKLISSCNRQGTGAGLQLDGRTNLRSRSCITGVVNCLHGSLCPLCPALKGRRFPRKRGRAGCTKKRARALSFRGLYSCSLRGTVCSLVLHALFCRACGETAQDTRGEGKRASAHAWHHTSAGEDKAKESNIDSD